MGTFVARQAVSARFNGARPVVSGEPVTAGGQGVPHWGGRDGVTKAPHLKLGQHFACDAPQGMDGR